MPPEGYIYIDTKVDPKKRTEFKKVKRAKFDTYCDTVRFASESSAHDPIRY